MLIVSWIVIGLIVGFVVSKILNLHGDDPRLGMAAGLGGALLFATVFTMITGAGVSVWNWWSILFAAIGAVAGLVIWHGVRSLYVSREPYTRRSSY